MAKLRFENIVSLSQWSVVNELAKLPSLVKLSCRNNRLVSSDGKQETANQMLIAKLEHLVLLNNCEVGWACSMYVCACVFNISHTINEEYHVTTMTFKMFFFCLLVMKRIIIIYCLLAKMMLHAYGVRVNRTANQNPKSEKQSPESLIK